MAGVAETFRQAVMLDMTAVDMDSDCLTGTFWLYIHALLVIMVWAHVWRRVVLRSGFTFIIMFVNSVLLCDSSGRLQA